MFLTGQRFMRHSWRQNRVERNTLDREISWTRVRMSWIRGKGYPRFSLYKEKSLLKAVKELMERIREKKGGDRKALSGERVSIKKETEKS